MDMDIENMKRGLMALGKEKIHEMSARALREAREDFRKFSVEVKKGNCDLCGKREESFNEAEPCLHWFLRPEGCRKKHIGILLEKTDFGFFRTMSYMRWLANVERPLANINDLPEEISSSKKIEVTIKYKNFEWAFSCSPNDYSGHRGSSKGAEPHYHFAMKIDGKIFISFSDFHACFTEEDMFNFKMMDAGLMKHIEVQGASVADIFKHFSPEEVFEFMQNPQEDEKAPFHLQTMIRAPHGRTFPGELFVEMHKESKKRGISIAKVAQERGLRGMTIISPGPGVPEMYKRTSRKKGSKKNTA